MRVLAPLLTIVGVEAWGIRPSSDEEVAKATAITDAHVQEWETRVAAGGDAGECNIDMRAQLPACKQVGVDWCWATGVANMAYYYGVYDNTTSCSDAECQVVSADMHTECCPYAQHKGCGVHGEDVKSIANVANEIISGHDFFVHQGAPHESYLQERLMEGKPVMVIVMWDSGRGHALTIGGCEPGTNVFGRNVTKYYVHDPEQNAYKTEQYGNIARYQAGGPHGIVQGKWAQAIFDRPAAAVAV